ncbi:MAG TPA: hypothetical protein PL131_01905 [Methylotenera sp.]|nr:hypothetical protein [Methylotenera sp.]HPH04601.1 hypothetical protein [Methylotenera sp.]HPN00724.1 hypothetical protein [Methylotenera sp.]
MHAQFKTLCTFSLALSLTACSTINLNPFNSGTKESSRVPANAISYICEGNKQFYVRMLNNGNEAWLIYPDHEVSLSKAAASNRYTSGAIALVINGDETTLNDGEKIAYTACKAQSKK